MNNLLLCFFIFSTLALSSVAQYDFFMMAMQWPPAVCRPKHANCVKSQGSQFTIHGLWPQNHTDPQPRQCSKHVRNVPGFVKSLLSQTIMTELATSWPNLKGKDDVFWGAEWFNHGTCSYSTFNEVQYFNAANNIWKALPLFNILRAAGISPSNTNFYKREDFKNAINKHIGVTVDFEFACPYFSSELLEIRVCKNHAGNAYVKCPNKGNCGTKFKWKP